MQQRVTLSMFEDTVYAYEFALAGMELQELTRQPDIPAGLPDGVIETEVDDSVLATLIERLAYVERINEVYTHQKHLTEVQGAVASNHSKAYMTHWMYPFKGKFHPQMIRAILNIIGAQKGDTVLDPMTGSGTVNVEAKLMGIDSIGLDCLPIAILASRVKTDSLNPKIAKAVLECEPPTPTPRGQSLTSFLDAPELKSINDVSNEYVRDFFKLLYFETLSISRLPKRNFEDTWKKMLGFYLQTIERSSQTIKELGLRLGNTKISLGDARCLDLDDESVDHIVTSPPYAIAIDYVVRNTEQLRQMGFSTKDIYGKTIGLRGKGASRISNYYDDLQRSVQEMHRVLRGSGSCVIVIGDTQYDRKTLPTISQCVAFGQAAGFRLHKNIPKISAGRFGLFRKERILIFEKPSA